MSSSNDNATWGFFLWVILKGLALFALCNLIFAAVYSMAFLGNLSLYNRILPGRTRLPYGENPALWYNVSTVNMEALFASHIIQQPKADDEFRVLVLGDSNTWGWLLEHDQTIAATINQSQATVRDKRIVAYNLGYPKLSLTKDLLILDMALDYQPDLIIWLVTLNSFAPENQLTDIGLVQYNPERIRPLIATYNLSINPQDERFVEPDFWQRTIIGQRRNLADLVRLQTYGFVWSATEIDQYISAEYELRQSDFEADASWGENYPEAVELTHDNLAFDVLAAGLSHAEDIPVLIINEPIFISDGQNSDIRYNSFYPRWAYDQYRILLADSAQENDWLYIDWWDAIAPDEFTDTPVHLTAEGSQQVGKMIVEWIQAE
jgi:hypothetical protein